VTLLFSYQTPSISAYKFRFMVGRQRGCGILVRAVNTPARHCLQHESGRLFSMLTEIRGTFIIGPQIRCFNKLAFSL
jgi:pyruvate/2-oxoglutarate/acetoin dehydrogenase E1 component